MARVLLVTPAFHGYWRSVIGALRRLGHEATAFRYDELATGTAKLHHKLRYELPTRVGLQGSSALTASHTTAAAAAVREARPDVVLTIKGDTLTEEYWDAIDTVGARSLLWLYDEYRRTRWTDERLRRVGPIASYSHLDVAALADRGFTTHFLANAYDPAAALIPHPVPAVTFVGARYANREELLTQLAAAGVPVRAYGRDWSHHPIDRLRTWQWHRPALAAGRDVPLAEAWGIMAGSTATVNMHHDQDGFTMRTFEACGVGAVQLLDRPDVTEFYEPGREVAVFTSPEEAIELSQRAAVDTAWASGLREQARRRTLAEHTFDHRMREVEQWWA
ncbi:glycosyltransferase [Raineyella sp. LH-20]|uniref:CgeB family protein n=1 Tax=Raineyella sp. LH-20 TaxID=3081204 RepID=UPI0029532D16|nr:glycosyltransferase [Raineyella sp. LH-20]WOP20110.1 glycosyltransferase [Raineyella sp. LH-20]